MNNLALQSYGVQELSAEQLSSVDGGFLPLIAAACLLLAGCAGAKVTISG